MPLRRPLALLALLASVLTACSGGGADEPAASPEASGAPTAVADGVAAVVNGSEIPAVVLEARVDNALATPEIADLLEGEQADAVRSQLRASVLSQLIVNEIVLDGAAGMGLDVDADAVDATREELVAEAGGAAAFEDQVRQAGLDADQLGAELEAITALRLVRAELAVTEGAESEAPAPGPTASAAPDDPATTALQQWLVEQLEEAEVAIDPELGTWSAEQGTVVPAGPAPQVPTGDPDPAPSAPASSPSADG